MIFVEGRERLWHSAHCSLVLLGTRKVGFFGARSRKGGGSRRHLSLASGGLGGVEWTPEASPAATREQKHE